MASTPTFGPVSPTGNFAPMADLSPAAAHTKTEPTPNASPPVNLSDRPRPKRGSPLMDIIQQSSGGDLKYICRSFESAADGGASPRRLQAVPGASPLTGSSTTAAASPRLLVPSPRASPRTSVPLATSTTAAASPRVLVPLPGTSPATGFSPAMTPEKFAEDCRKQNDVLPLAPFSLSETLGANPLGPSLTQGHAQGAAPGHTNCPSSQMVSSKMVTLQADPFVAPAARSSVRYTRTETIEPSQIKMQAASPLMQFSSPTPQAASPLVQFSSPTLQSTSTMFQTIRPLSETTRMPPDTAQGAGPAVASSSRLLTELRERRINFVQNATSNCKGDLWEAFLESLHSDVSNFAPPASKEGARHIFPPPAMWEAWERDLLSHMDLSKIPTDKRGHFGVVPCIQREALRFLYGCGLKVETAQQAMEAQTLWRNRHLPFRWSELKRPISSGAAYISGADRFLRPILVLRLNRLRAVKAQLAVQSVTEMYFCFWIDVCRSFLLHDEKISQINVVIDAAGVDYPFVQNVIQSLINVCRLYPMLFSKVHVVNWKDLPVPKSLTQKALQSALCEMGLEDVCVFDELQDLPVSALETDLGGSRPVMQNFKSLRRLLAPLLVSSRSWAEKNYKALGSLDQSVTCNDDTMMSFRTVADTYRPSGSRTCQEDSQNRRSGRSHRSVSQSRRSQQSHRSVSTRRSQQSHRSESQSRRSQQSHRSVSQRRRSRWSGSSHQDTREGPLIPPAMASWEPPVNAICSHSGRHIFSIPATWSPEEQRAVQDLAFALPENLPPTIYDDEAHMLRVLYGCDFDTTIAVQDIEEAAQHCRRRLAVTEDHDMKVKATCGAVYFHGRDKRLRPVLVVNAARLKAATITVNDLCHIFDYWIMFAIDYLFVPGKVEQLVCLVDMSGAGVFDIPLLKLPRLLTHLRRLYHSRLRKVIVVNHTRMVRSMWGPLSNSLTAMELERVSIVKERPEEVLLSHIPEDQLERRLGGRAKNLKAGFRMPPFVSIS